MASATVAMPSASTPSAILRVTERVDNSEFYQGHMDSITVPATPARISKTTDAKNVAVSGRGCTARGRGKDAVVVAAGSFSHAKLLRGDKGEAVAAAGAFCLAENHDSFASMAAVGDSARSISHQAGCPAVTIGYAPIAEHKAAGGIAICIGSEPIASAGPGGYLVFLDVSSVGAPKAHIFAVGENGIEPHVPYLFMPGMYLPERADEDPEYAFATGPAYRAARRRATKEAHPVA